MTKYFACTGLRVSALAKCFRLCHLTTQNYCLLHIPHLETLNRNRCQIALFTLTPLALPTSPSSSNKKARRTCQERELCHHAFWLERTITLLTICHLLLLVGDAFCRLLELRKSANTKLASDFISVMTLFVSKQNNVLHSCAS